MFGQIDKSRVKPTWRSIRHRVGTRRRRPQPQMTSDRSFAMAASWSTSARYMELALRCDSFSTRSSGSPLSTAPVIILGESGSGKELVATTLHQLSSRSAQPFIAVNCGAIAENLIESELFGHERGSFTGASRTHRGCFERASGGTLFLDEITEMPVEMQVRLLRVLETGRFCRVGGDNEISTDVRVLAASNRDLQQAVASGRLREDLMYRLCVIPVTVPALRERENDALLLAEMFLHQLNDEHAVNKSLSDPRQGADTRLFLAGQCTRAEERHPSCIRTFGRRCRRDIDTSKRIEPAPVTTILDVAEPAKSRLGEGFAVRIPVGMSLDAAEKALITATLQAVAGSKSKAAQVLGISLKTLYNRSARLRRCRCRATRGRSRGMPRARRLMRHRDFAPGVDL